MSRPKSQIGNCIADYCESRQYSKGLCQKHYNRQWRGNSLDCSDVSYRLMKNVDKSSGCWVWIGHRAKSGYGRIQNKGKKVRSHRLSYETYVGKIPDGMNVLHRCDNPPCINPDHLFLGTHKDNMKDAQNKGRFRSIDENMKNKRSQNAA